MTFQDGPFQNEGEVRRASRGSKVLGFGCAVLGVLGSFWGIVWFIRAYVEAPRVNIPAPMQLASRESVPIPASALKPAQARPAEAPRPAQAPAPEPTGSVTAQTAPAAPAIVPAPPAAAEPVAAAPPPTPEASPAGAIAERWFSGNQFGIITSTPAPTPPGPPAPPPVPVEVEPVNTAPAALATNGNGNTADAEPPIEEVEEGSVPAIAGPAPLPRRKPVITASAAARRNDVTPLPRPRPDGPAPQSVWTGVPSSDERFGSSQ